jgi:hypothetical protein
MTEFKNVKVPKATHEKLVSRAKDLGLKTYVLTEVLLEAGLELSIKNVQQRVVTAQQTTQQLGDTTTE